MVSISVVIPTYNRSDVIGRALDSVSNQTYDDYEIVVVDDGSNDDTKKIVQKYQDRYKNIRFIQHSENKGANAARNTGVRNSNGEYISFLDSDDEFYPNHLEVVSKTVENLPDSFAGVYTSFKQVTQDGGEKINKHNGQVFLEEMLRHNPIGGFSATTLKKASILEVGLLDEDLPAYQDRDIFIRLLEKYDLYGIDKVLFSYNLQDDSISNNPDKRIRAINKLKEKHTRKMGRKEVAHIQYTKGFIYADAGQMSNAAKGFRSAISLNPYYLLYYYHYISSKMGSSAFKYSVKIKEKIKEIQTSKPD